MPKNIFVEVAVESLDQALCAEEMGADRIELCANLSQGGLTPTIGLVKACIRRLKIPIHVMLRSKPGGFVYAQEDWKIMLDDWKILSSLPISGIVFGALTTNLKIDYAKVEYILSKCKNQGIDFTFHRAFDIIEDKVATIKDLVDLGVDNILTSGGKAKAIDALDYLKALNATYGQKINIMVGSGINGKNVCHFVDAGIQNIHFTCYRSEIGDANTPIYFGDEHLFDRQKMSDIMLKI